MTDTNETHFDTTETMADTNETHNQHFWFFYVEKTNTDTEYAYILRNDIKNQNLFKQFLQNKYSFDWLYDSLNTIDDCFILDRWRLDALEQQIQLQVLRDKQFMLQAKLFDIDFDDDDNDDNDDDDDTHIRDRHELIFKLDDFDI